MTQRQKATDFIIQIIDEILPDGFNRDRTKAFLEKMSDAEFEAYMRDLKSEKQRLVIIAPNGAKVRIDLKRNFDVAKKHGIDFFKRIWMSTPDGKGKYLSHDKYLILKLPIRRQSQILIKKISIPTDNKSVDSLTGQPAGDSVGAKISYPEVQMLASLGLKDTLGEFMKFRGGDLRGFHAMNTMINRTGGVSLRAIEPYSGKVKSTETLSAYLTALHLTNNL